ncbi:MAG TPA: EAL domain-containing protein [Bacillaceae bacterium]
MDRINKSPGSINGLPARRSEKMMSEIFLHHLSDMIFIMEVEPGPRFRYFFVNQMGMEFAGLKQEHIGQMMEDVLPKNRADFLMQYYSRALHSNEPVAFIEEARSRNELANVFESRLTAIKNEDGIIQYIISVTRDIHWRSAEAIKYLELHDQMTGSWNRQALMEHLQIEIATSLREGREFAIVNIDLDRFKHFNDSLGHKAGDKLLKLVTERLMSWNKPGHRLYRLGGDEFVILLSDSDRKETDRCARELIELFDVPFCVNSQEYYITPSIGISMFPMDGRDADTLLKNADNALFLVKEKGRAHYRFYRSWMADNFPSYILMEAHLRKAIEKNEFTIHYQPQVNLKNGEILSFEALLRWNNRKFGTVSPSHFIPVAEDTGLIIPIGEWVIREVCRQISVWRSKGHTGIRVAVNISPRQFMEPNLPSVIKMALEEYGLPASMLEIEITEGAMEDTRATLGILHRLKDLGVILSVDDFGTGYSSLNYLKRFPIDILKIDQSFVKEIMENYKNAAITKTIIHLAHSLGLEVVAEGVEEEVQADFLAEANCEKAQGYFFSRPVSAEQIEEKILLKAF